MKTILNLFFMAIVISSTCLADQSLNLESCYQQNMFANYNISRDAGLNKNAADENLEIFDSISLNKKNAILKKIDEHKNYDRYLLLTMLLHECLYPNKKETFDSINALQLCVMKDSLLFSIQGNRGFGIDKNSMMVYLLQNEPHLLPISHLARNSLFKDSIEQVFNTPYEEVLWSKEVKVKDSFLFKKMSQCINTTHNKSLNTDAQKTRAH
jgi:hypothetical protein